MSEQGSVTSLAFTETSLRGRAMRVVMSRSHREWGRERSRKRLGRRTEMPPRLRRRGENKMTPIKDWGRQRGTRVEKRSQGGEWESRQGENGTLWHWWEAGEPLHLIPASLQRHRYSLYTRWSYLDAESQLGWEVTRPHLSLQPAAWWPLKHWIPVLTSLLSFWFSLPQHKGTNFLKLYTWDSQLVFMMLCFRL